MKQEHLIQAYNLNKINAKIIQEVNEDNEKAGVIQFSNNIIASYLLDNEDIVIDLIISCNMLATTKRVENQFKNTIEIIKVLQKSIELLANIPQKETNMILEKIGLFDGTFKEGKQIKHLDYIFKIQTMERLLIFNIKENTKVM